MSTHLRCVTGEAGVVRYFVLILGLFLIGAALQSAPHSSAHVSIQDWPKSGLHLLQPNPASQAASGSASGLDPSSEDSSTADTAIHAHNLKYGLRRGSDPDMRPECLAVTDDNSARAPPLTV